MNIICMACKKEFTPDEFDDGLCWNCYKSKLRTDRDLRFIRAVLGTGVSGLWQHRKHQVFWNKLWRYRSYFYPLWLSHPSWVTEDIWLRIRLQTYVLFCNFRKSLANDQEFERWMKLTKFGEETK